jgi:hypothetical protein
MVLQDSTKKRNTQRRRQFHNTPLNLSLELNFKGTLRKNRLTGMLSFKSMARCVL